jgi:hypothetical protein
MTLHVKNGEFRARCRFWMDPLWIGDLDPFVTKELRSELLTFMVDRVAWHAVKLQRG